MSAKSGIWTFAVLIQNIAWQQDHERKQDLFPETQLSAAYTAKNPAYNLQRTM